MKTKSRIHKSLTILFVVMSLATFSGMLFYNCQRTEDFIDNNLDVPDAYKEVGASHNEGLEYIFTKIQDNCLEYAKNYDTDPLNTQAIDYPAIAREALVEFCKTNPKTKEISQLYEVSLQSDYFLKSSHVPEIQPDMKELIDRIQLSLKHEFTSKNLKQLKKELNLVNQMAANQLSADDAAAIFCATSTAYSSFQYWNKNYRVWYFALNYPEIMGQFEKSELNKLSLKSSTSILDTIPGGQSRLKAFWDGYEGWINNMGDALDYWWEEYGEKVIVSDCLGAITGTYDAVIAAGASSLVFGPEGLVVVGAAGAIVGGIDASAFAITGTGILELLNP